MLHIVLGNTSIGFRRGKHLDGQDKTAIAIKLGFICIFICSKATSKATLKAVDLATKGKSMVSTLKEVEEYRQELDRLKIEDVEKEVKAYKCRYLDFQGRLEKAYNDLWIKDKHIKDLEITIRQLKRLNNEDAQSNH